MDEWKEYLKDDELRWLGQSGSYDITSVMGVSHGIGRVLSRLSDCRKALQSIIDYEEDNYGDLNYFNTIDAMKDIARKALGYQKGDDD
jgi:hypothetical protein